MLALAFGIQKETSAQVEFVIPMTRGWNMISAPVIPEERDITVMFQDIVERDNLIIVKDGFGGFYLPEFNFNNMADWDFRNGYLVKLARDDNLLIEGEPVDSETPIPLRRGWNMVAYFPEQRIQAWDAFLNIRRQLIIVKDIEGHFFSYDFAMLVLWLERSQGYQVKVSNDVELIWP